MTMTCKMCMFPDQVAVHAAFSTRGSDREIARQFGVSAMAVNRHRRHLVTPIRAADNALGGGNGAGHVIAEADPVVVTRAVSLSAQVARLIDLNGVLTRMIAQAEASGSVGAASNLIALALRSVEIACRLGRLGAYGNLSVPDQGGVATKFEVSIIFNGANRTESFTTSARAPVVDSADFSPGVCLDEGEDRS